MNKKKKLKLNNWQIMLKELEETIDSVFSVMIFFAGFFGIPFIVGSLMTALYLTRDLHYEAAIFGPIATVSTIFVIWGLIAEQRRQERKGLEK